MMDANVEEVNIIYENDDDDDDKEETMGELFERMPPEIQVSMTPRQLEERLVLELKNLVPLKEGYTASGLARALSAGEGMYWSQVPHTALTVYVSGSLCEKDDAKEDPLADIFFIWRLQDEKTPLVVFSETDDQNQAHLFETAQDCLQYITHLRRIAIIERQVHRKCQNDPNTIKISSSFVYHETFIDILRESHDASPSE